MAPEVTTIAAAHHGTEASDGASAAGNMVAPTTYGTARTIPITMSGSVRKYAAVPIPPSTEPSSAATPGRASHSSGGSLRMRSSPDSATKRSDDLPGSV